MARATKAQGTETESTTKGKPRPTAVVSTLDLDSGLGEDDFTSTNRRTSWDVKLDELYALTADGKVPRDEAGRLKFVLIGQYGNDQGARAQVKAFEKRGLDKTYDFKSVRDKLFARVIETADADTDEV